MRDRRVTAVANIDSANFSARTNPQQLVATKPQLMRVPYLYILSADTRAQSDRYADFEKMKFSRRYEVVLKSRGLLHHDLSNVGRAVSASLKIRGDAQDMVLKTYADVQATLLEFLDANRHPESRQFSQRLQQLRSDAAYAVTVRDGVEAAPPLYDVLTAIDDWTPQRLREVYRRDADSEVFSEMVRLANLLLLDVVAAPFAATG